MSNQEDSREQKRIQSEAEFIELLNLCFDED
jgi:hypothetical protein